jgi:hypothetical protein
MSSSVASRSCSRSNGILVAEDRGTLGLGVVAADALEDAGAVVQAVREHVDLRVLPRDELAVHPNEVRCVHACSF